jgi:hypothetical protein
LCARVYGRSSQLNQTGRLRLEFCMTDEDLGHVQRGKFRVEASLICTQTRQLVQWTQELEVRMYVLSFELHMGHITKMCNFMIGVEFSSN